MTKSRGIGRGGKRPNTGPKPKPKAPAIERPAARTGQSLQERAIAGLDLAFATLEHIEMNGVTEGARVSAAKIIIETAKGNNVGGPLGKKDQMQAEADNAGRSSEWEGDLEFVGGRPN